MHRFFVSPVNIRDGKIYFSDEISHQMVRVLRLKMYEQVLVLDNQGKEYDVQLVEMQDRQVMGEIIHIHQTRNEPAIKITLYLSLCQREKFEWMLQKCTEVGISTFSPVATSRSLVQKIDDFHRKNERWNRIIQEAAEQAGRGKIPTLNPPIDFQQALFAAKITYPYNIILWEGEQARSLSRVVSSWKQEKQASIPGVGLFVGPEGGYSEDEISSASEAEIISVSLGKRILRTETAAIVGSAFILHDLDEMG